MRVLVTDGDNRAALAVTRSLGRAGHQVIVGEKRRRALAHASKHCAAAFVYADPIHDPDGFVDDLAREVERRDIEALLPVADVTTLLVTGSRERFDRRCAIPFAPYETIRRAADKVDIIQTAERLGVAVPRSVAIGHLDECAGVDLQFPLVIKPHRSRVRTPNGWLSTGVSYAGDREQLMRDLRGRHPQELPVLLQERIAGPGIGIFACYQEGRPIALFSHRRIRERPPSGGVSVLSESIPLHPVARDYAMRLLDELRWHGVAMVEFKQDVRDNIPKLMEINGRFWGSLQLAIDAGVDFPRLLLDGAAPGVSPAAYRIGVRSRWFWGDVDSLVQSLFAGEARGSSGGRVRALKDFLMPGGKELHYENPRWNDLGPGLSESARWFETAFKGAWRKLTGGSVAGAFRLTRQL